MRAVAIRKEALRKTGGRGRWKNSKRGHAGATTSQWAGSANWGVMCVQVWLATYRAGRQRLAGGGRPAGMCGPALPLAWAATVPAGLAAAPPPNLLLRHGHRHCCCHSRTVEE